MEVDQSDELPFSPRDFDPTAEELIGHYLKNHILKKSYPESGTIQEATVFGENINPWEKFCNEYDPYPWEEGDSTSPPTLFLFTKLSNVGNTDKSNNIQKNRRAGCGTWHGTSCPIPVTSSAEEDVVIGHYRVLSFRSTNGEETEGQWTMYEYGISPEAFPEILNVNGWENQVVCRIKRDDTKSNVGGKVTKNKNKRKSSPKPLPNKRKSTSKAVPNKRKSSSKVAPNKRRRTASSEEEEKPAVVDNARFVNEEPADQVHYGELTETDDFTIDMDELFDGIECCD